jgi:mono/diheme cytochrome c family protein
MVCNNRSFGMLRTFRAALRSLPPWRKGVVFCGGCALGIAIQAAGQQGTAGAGDVAKGQEIAEQVCGICHGKSTPLGVDDVTVPTLADIANSPDFSAVRFRTMMAVPPHSDMPTPRLSDKERDDVVAFVESLRKKR